ncbi:hypothetical protein P154DRAFT_603813 [Amniculicola lignicola CBS 123094]|uniref:Uncharacterized protein n=1 Tax=Amniculicola lignicola CBS 123094 TaxID=1392246 RepID=A0A6A5WZ84_9PLEO|nr:hypothetical protein P154DRAFT_603813 [Amniculicola lignicola CBS 123094]
MENQKIQLDDLLDDRFSPIQATLMSYLNPGDIAALAKTSPDFSHLQGVLLKGEHSINKALRQFFETPIEFRNLQAQWNALLSGDFVACFLGRKPFQGKCMTITVKTKYRTNVEQYLKEEGYTLKAPRDPTADIKCAIYENAPGAIIELWWSDNPPIFDILTRTSHTALLNVISWNKVYSLFPVPTFVEEQTYLLERMNESLSGPLRSISESGWTTKSIHWKQEDVSGDYQGLTRPRQIKDRHTWMFKLDTTGMTPSNVPDFVLESTTFKLLVSKHDRRITSYVMNIKCIFKQPVLRYEYVTRSTDKAAPSYGDAIKELEDRLTELTIMEIIKIPKEERSQDLESLLNRDGQQSEDFRERFVPPPTWNFHDVELIAFLQEVAERDEDRYKGRFQRKKDSKVKTLRNWEPEEETTLK